MDAAAIEPVLANDQESDGEESENDQDVSDKVDDSGNNPGALEQTDDGAEAKGGEEPETAECHDTRTGTFRFKPSAEEVERHRLHHYPFRSWCEWCIKGKALGEQHKASQHKSDVPVVSADYFFLTSGPDSTGEKEEKVLTRTELDMSDKQLEEQRVQGSIVKCLALRCSMSKAVFAWVVPCKGSGENGYITGLVVTALRWLAYTRVILKCDNEPALLQLMRNAIALAKTEVANLAQIGEEHPTAYDSQANGGIESAIRVLRQDLRTMRLDLESRLGAEVPIDHPLMAWLVRHVAFLYTAFMKGSDGRTPWERVRGRPYSQRIYHFAERVHWKLPTKGPKSQPRGNAASRWEAGLYLGNEMHANSYIVSLGKVTVASRAIERFPEQDRWSREVTQALTVTPGVRRRSQNAESSLASPSSRSQVPRWRRRRTCGGSQSGKPI